MLYCDCIEEFDGFERLRYWEMISACDVAFITATIDKRASAARLDAEREKHKFRRKQFTK